MCSDALPAIRIFEGNLPSDIAEVVLVKLRLEAKELKQAVIKRADMVGFRLMATQTQPLADIPFCVLVYARVNGAAHLGEIIECLSEDTALGVKQNLLFYSKTDREGVAAFFDQLGWMQEFVH